MDISCVSLIKKKKGKKSVAPTNAASRTKYVSYVLCVT